ncbi:MAG: glycosyltransferase [Hungatella sp.]|nr:glycosyltransferase [Hungatella sp.]
MIVKNEEENMERALSWGKGIVSEQIVIDTGSTDRTIDIARQMGATVYNFLWIDDFAAAKNYAISKAQYQWIAFLDADEYFSSEDAKKLLIYLKQLHDKAYDGIVTAFIDLDNNGKIIEAGSHLRIFRNIHGLRYYRRIHESLIKNNGSKIQAANMTEELTIYHTGYGKKENQKKQKRNLNLILAELAEYPDDYEMYGYLGNTYSCMGELSLAKEAYRKAITLMPKEKRGIYGVTSSETFQRYLNILSISSESEESELLSIYRQARDGWPEDGDFDYILGQYYCFHGNYQSGENHLKQAIELLERYGYTSKSALLSGQILKAYEMLAMCYFNIGNLEECVKITAMMLKENPYLMSVLIVMLSALLKDPGTGGRGKAGALDTVAFLGNNFYQLHSLKDRLFILQAAIGSGYQNLVDVVKDGFTPEEFTAVNQALGGKLSKSINQGNCVQLVSIPSTAFNKRKKRNLRIALFYSPTESFNFFADQLVREFQERGYETFILDLQNPPADDPHSYVSFARFAASGIDVAICNDAMCIRDQTLIDIWNEQGTVVVDIFMDPPLRFHLSLENTPRRYLLFCCDREHVKYVKQYFKKEVPKVDFMPHVGVLPGKRIKVIPYKERKYDILFCGTYYRPEEQMGEIRRLCPENSTLWKLYQEAFENLKRNSHLSVVEGVLLTMDQMGMALSEKALKSTLNISNYVDWAIRMYQRGRVVTTLAESGLDLYLLGRGWENLPSAGLPNVHRIDDRIPYGNTLAYMADARINLNVMPGFKQGTHDRIFNTLLQRSVPLTDSSAWIDDNYTDGVDIALYDLDHLEKLPGIARNLLENTELAERIIENGYKKTAGSFTWGHCADWILKAIKEEVVSP